MNVALHSTLTVTPFAGFLTSVTFYQVLPVGDGGGGRSEGGKGSALPPTAVAVMSGPLWHLGSGGTVFGQLPQWQGHWANYLMLQPLPT